jgi:hypothetical protein
MQKRAVTSEKQKRNPSRRSSLYSSTTTYLSERTDQKKREYNRRIQKDKEKKTRGQCKIQTAVRDSLSRRN